jgi:IS5 family transposase
VKEQEHDVSRHPYPEVNAMIAQTFEDVFSPQWVETHIIDPAHDLVILRHIIPWQPIIDYLVPFYDNQKGRMGHSLRTLVATLLVSRLRQLSDRKVIKQLQENRYMQYFCNVPDQGLLTFLNPSTLCRFRKRLGESGITIIEDQVFERLKGAGVIDADTMLMDSSVLESPIIYPNDVRLIYKAFGKMAVLAGACQLALWWDHDHIKKRWRAYNLTPKQRLAYLAEFHTLFQPALQTFARRLDALQAGHLKERWQQLLAALTILDEQSQQKLAGESHIDHRLVSLDDLDARPIKRGKSHPSTEFGTTTQMTFNRQGFMITTENFIGHPNDTTLYGPTLERFRKRMHGYPNLAVTDQGFRSADNLKLRPKGLKQVFMGRSTDVDEALQDACRKARSATEGFIAVAKHLRGFGRSLYRALTGARIWTLLTQSAYNLQKFLQLYRNEALEESTLVKLRL